MTLTENRWDYLKRIVFEALHPATVAKHDHQQRTIKALTILRNEAISNYIGLIADDAVAYPSLELYSSICEWMGDSIMKVFPIPIRAISSLPGKQHFIESAYSEELAYLLHTRYGILLPPPDSFPDLYATRRGSW